MSEWMPLPEPPKETRMSKYVNCPKHGEDAYDVDTGCKECDADLEMLERKARAFDALSKFPPEGHGWIINFGIFGPVLEYGSQSINRNTGTGDDTLLSAVEAAMEKSK